MLYNRGSTFPFLLALSLTIVLAVPRRATSSLKSYYYLPLQPISRIAIKRPHGMITEGPRINLTLLDAFVKESDSHVAESCSMRQTNRRENYVHARGDLTEGRKVRSGGNGRTGNVFKFMAAFKTPSASGRGLQESHCGGGEWDLRRGRGARGRNRRGG